jgi:hypothetical protein
MPLFQSLAPPSLQIGRSVLESHDYQVRGRRRERSRRPAQGVWRVGAHQICRSHGQSYGDEMETAPQVDPSRRISEMLARTSEGKSPHQREGQDRPAAEQ